jgi:hypothetical protein
MCSHTGSTNHEWAGAYSRASRGAGAGARVTSVALSSKQGAVLHFRDAGRIYTVREIARMHGFPDSFRFGVDEALPGGVVVRSDSDGGGGDGRAAVAGGAPVAAASAAAASAATGAGVGLGAGAGAGAGEGAPPAGGTSRVSDAQSAAAARRVPAALGAEVAFVDRGTAAAAAKAITVAYHGIGNAVPPPFGRDVARSVLRASGR